VDFQAWVSELVGRRFGTMTALASAVGMQLSPFVRGVDSGTLNIVNLLRLAEVADENPSRVLRLAGKEKVAELIERLYGAPTLTPSQRELIANLEQVPASVRENFAVLIRHARDVAVHAGGGPRERTPPAPASQRRRRAAAPRSNPNSRAE